MTILWNSTFSRRSIRSNKHSCHRARVRLLILNFKWLVKFYRNTRRLEISRARNEIRRDCRGMNVICQRKQRTAPTLSSEFSIETSAFDKFSDERTKFPWKESQKRSDRTIPSRGSPRITFPQKLPRFLLNWRNTLGILQTFRQLRRETRQTERERERKDRKRRLKITPFTGRRNWIHWNRVKKKKKENSPRSSVAVSVIGWAL